MPALMCQAMAELDIAGGDLQFLAAFGLAKVAVFIGVVWVSYLSSSRSDLAEAALRGISATQGNDFALGLPLLAALYPPAMLRLVFLTGVIQLAVVNPAGFWLMEHARHGASAAEIATRTAASPPVAGTVTGLVINAIWGHGPHALVSDVLRTLGAAFAACALVTLGGTLHGKAGRMRDATGPPLLMVCTKSCILPTALSATLAAANCSCGTDVGDLCVFAFILGTLPIAPNVFLFAVEYDIDPQESVTAVLLSTALAGPTALAAALLVTANASTLPTVRAGVALTAAVSAGSAVWVLCGRRCSIPHKEDAAAADPTSGLDVTLLCLISAAAGAAPAVGAFLADEGLACPVAQWAVRGAVLCMALAAYGGSLAVLRHRLVLWPMAAAAALIWGGARWWLHGASRTLLFSVEISSELAACTIFLRLFIRAASAAVAGPAPGDRAGDRAVMMFHAVSALVSALSAVWAVRLGGRTTDGLDSEGRPALAMTHGSAAAAAVRSADAALGAMHGVALWAAYAASDALRRALAAVGFDSDAEPASAHLGPSSARIPPSPDSSLPLLTPPLQRAVLLLGGVQPALLHSALTAATADPADGPGLGGFVVLLTGSASDTEVYAVLVCEGSYGGVARLCTHLLAAAQPRRGPDVVCALRAGRRGLPIPFNLDGLSERHPADLGAGDAVLRWRLAAALDAADSAAAAPVSPRRVLRACQAEQPT
eukprot:TRINITY_DN45930_c0_g1_i1.p1 TRINITY_DN45930_c0_g1~~TRINITY_DN45930_c0_g1_i1.p1  ORF type:complete len:788 (+),score=148.26 TRINITY_DN45930_c0_g1_i1:227-2365(+)